ncbi:MAG TPA: HAMP domain-containing sensor histidine kinase [Candidatus Baltobacteraceae bacterium]|jgi:signal transduction histidine kinase|nr:HAMP domain-containing sensor histidine kinase [Candidatus Baltobacteraceae bacterium]
MTRTQLTATFVAIMFAGLLILAAAAVFTNDRTLRASLDSRLSTQAKAAAVFADVKRGKLAVDADDRAQFLGVLGPGSAGFVADGDGNVVLSSSANVLHVPAGAGDRETYFNAGSGERAVRAFASPVLRDGTRVGTIVVWRSSAYIGESDRNAAIAFAGAAVAIALLALVAAHFVTRRALEDAFSRQRRFTADASHELRAPLAVIRAEADLALRRDREPAEYRAAIQTIASEADRIESLIGDLLSAARAESRRLSRERVDAAGIVRRVSERLRPALAAKQGVVDVDVPADAYVLADQHALERAIMAVGHNAAQHVPKDGNVRMLVQRDGEWLEIDVRDDGPGFSDAALAHAFDRFWRESPGAAEGSGLGLAIAKSIVESLGGRIELSNGPQGGAQVRIRLPAAG